MAFLAKGAETKKDSEAIKHDKKLSMPTFKAISAITLTLITSETFNNILGSTVILLRKYHSCLHCV